MITDVQLTPESWEPIPSLEGLYAASSLGRIKRLIAPELLLVARTINSGYLVVDTRLNGQRKTCLVHRLVFEAFHGLIPEGFDVCHRNHLRTDNTAKNLYAATRSQNIRDSVRDGRPVGKGMTGIRPKSARLLNHQHIEIVNRYAGGALQNDIAAEYGISQCRVSQIIRSFS